MMASKLLRWGQTRFSDNPAHCITQLSTKSNYVMLNIRSDGELEDEIAQRVVEKLRDELANLLQEGGPGKVRGIDPYARYDASFLADRWSVSKDTVYRMDADELPRAEWAGQGVRYLGLDILRYEGVDVNTDSSNKATSNTSTAPRPPEQRGDGARPYNNSLPEL